MIGTAIFVIIVLISIIQDFVNKETRQCIDNHKHIAIITIIHHLFANFILFGWMITPIWVVKLYLILLILTVIYWGTVGYCHVTKYVNKTCKWDRSKYFNDLTYAVKASKKEWILYIVGAILAIYRLYNPTVGITSYMMLAMAIPIIPPF